MRTLHQASAAFGFTTLALTTLAWLGSTSAATLEVGPGKPFSRIEEANAKAQAGDLILVYPRGGPYEKTAVFVRQKNLTFRGVPGGGKANVAISGQGFDFSGVGSTPRAIFQFNPGSDNCMLEGFDLSGAHNASHNGAGVRINQANHVAVRKCSIHNNDMGIMSNGDGSLATAVDQRIEECRIYRNGDPTAPGFNHNLYLGGTSVILRFCEIHHSLTGQNVKSRAHYTRVEYCYVHHSANREFDLVNADETARPKSDAVLLGNIIVKDPRCSGNHAVIHFGQDGGKGHDGTLYLAFNTVVTPFISPVVDLSAARAKASLFGNVVASGARQAGQKVAGVSLGATLGNIGGASNWFCGDFSAQETGLDANRNHFEPGSDLFFGPRDNDYRLPPQECAADESCRHGPVARAAVGARSARLGGLASLGVAISLSGGRRETSQGGKRHGRGMRKVAVHAYTLRVKGMPRMPPARHGANRISPFSIRSKNSRLLSSRSGRFAISRDVNQWIDSTSRGLGTATAVGSISASHQARWTFQAVTHSHSRRTGRIAMPTSSSTSRATAVSSVSPSSIPPPGKQYSSGAMTCRERRITNMRPSWTTIATAPQRPGVSGIASMQQIVAKAGPGTRATPRQKIRNPKSETNAKSKKEKAQNILCRRCEHCFFSSFRFVSDFVRRISDLNFSGVFSRPAFG